LSGETNQPLINTIDSHSLSKATSPLSLPKGECEMDTEQPSRQEVEDLFFREAALLDEWRLEEWLTLLADDATYQIPPTDVPEADPRNTLFIIADDAVRIRSRVKQLLGKSAWAENPHSRTRRIISNVRVLGSDGAAIVVTANFAVYRMRYELVDVYVGHYDYKLVRVGKELRIRERRAVLDNEALRPQGKISFIL
jgi:p-cumate 2,3-dioxygenase beta subunit